MIETGRFATVSLNKSHDRAAFDCGSAELNAYLRRQAGQEQRKRVAFPFVMIERNEPSRILGYYTLSASAMPLDDIPEPLRRRLPRYPDMPVTLLGRLAVDHAAQGQGLGELLLIDALDRAFRASSVASMAIVTDPKDEKARAFYNRYGFEPLVRNSTRMYLKMQTVADLLSQ